MDFATELGKLTLNNLNEFSTWIQGAKDWTMEQVPLLVQEYITWIIVSNLLSAMFSLVLIIICSFVARKAYNLLKLEVSKGSDEAEHLPVVVFGIITAVASVVVFTQTVNLTQPIETAIKGLVAPRVLVLEVVRDLASPAIKEVKDKINAK